MKQKAVSHNSGDLRNQDTTKLIGTKYIHNLRIIIKLTK